MYPTTDPAEQAALVRRLAPLVRRLAHRLKATLPANVEVDDLIQYGWLGLIEAVKRYQPLPGVEIEAFAAPRIRGAMYDGLRQEDWLPRQARQAMHRVEDAIGALQARLGRAPGDREIAAHLGLDLPAYHALLTQAHGHPLVFIEDLSAGGAEEFFDRHAGARQDDPQADLLAGERRARLIAAIAALPEREQVIMGLLYTEGLNLREIGAVLGLSESRVCQLHGQAIARLRARLRDDPPAPARRALPPRRPLPDAPAAAPTPPALN